jgi:hypothetical protein
MQFTNWTLFDSRANLKDIQYPGIYALAISQINLTDQTFSYIREIVYFGMTNSRTGLAGRLNAFNNSLRDKSGPGHGGCERFRYDHEDGTQLAKKLYVAICPFECNVKSIARKDLTAMGEVARAEYLAFAEYADKFNKLPKYNDKNISPKRKPTIVYKRARAV